MSTPLTPDLEKIRSFRQRYGLPMPKEPAGTAAPGLEDQDERIRTFREKHGLSMDGLAPARPGSRFAPHELAPTTARPPERRRDPLTPREAPPLRPIMGSDTIEPAPSELTVAPLPEQMAGMVEQVRASKPSGALERAVGASISAAPPERRVPSVADRVQHAGSRFARSAIEGLGADAVEGLAVLGQEFQGMGLDVDGTDLDSAGPDQQARAMEWAERVRDWAENAFPGDPDLQGRFVSDVLPQAFGSAASFILARFAGGPGSAAGLGAAMGAGAQHREAVAFGADPESAQRSARLAAALGLTEALPVERVFGTAARAARGAGRGALREALPTAAAEAGQEAFQTTGSNLIARREFDPDRRVTEGVGSATAAGAIVGGALGAGGAVVGEERAERRDARIVAAAVRTPDGRVFQGGVHPEAFDKAMAAGALNEPLRNIRAPRGSDDHLELIATGQITDGYVTADGRFITRTEAAELTGVRGPAGVPAVEDLQDAGVLPRQPESAPEPAAADDEKIRAFREKHGLPQAEAPVESEPEPAPARRPLRQRIADLIDRERAQRLQQREEELRKARRQVEVDPLTGLGSREALQRARASVDEDPAWEWVAIDADGLKGVNDTMGHDAGDELLREIGGAIAEQSPRGFHPSGDEFMVAVPAGQGEAIGRAIEETVGRLQIEGTGLTAGVSFGVGPTLTEADAALNSAKDARASQQGSFRPRAGVQQPEQVAEEEVETTDSGERIAGAAENVERPFRWVQHEEWTQHLAAGGDVGMSTIDAQGKTIKIGIRTSFSPSDFEAELTPAESKEARRIAVEEQLATGDERRALVAQKRDLARRVVQRKISEFEASEAAVEAAPEPAAPSRPRDFLEGLDDDEPAREKIGGRTEEDDGFFFEPPGARKQLYRTELKKARALTDAALIKAYNQKQRVAVRLQADAAGRPGPGVRNNLLAAEARLVAHEQAIDARGLEKPTVVDAWRDIPASEREGTFALGQALDEAEAMADPQLLDEMHASEEAFLAQPADRRLAERVYAFAAVAKDRGLIGGGMMPEAIGALQDPAPGGRPRAAPRSSRAGDPVNDVSPVSSDRPPSDPLRPPEAREPIDGERLTGRLAKVTMPKRGEPVSRPQVMKAISRVLEVAGGAGKIRVGRLGTKRARGWFNVKTEMIRINSADNIPTAAHEMGHALEKLVYGWDKGGPWKQPLVSAKIQAELLALGKALYGNTTPVGGYKREGWAEFMRLYLTTDQAASKAPTLAKWFEDEFSSKHPDVKKAIIRARELAERWRMQGAQERAKQSIVDPGAPKERAKRAASRVAEHLTMEQLVEMAEPIARVKREAEARLGRELEPEKDPFLTISALRMTHSARARYMVENGMIDLNGNRIGPALAEIRALVKGRQTDFTLYLWARRAVKLWTDPKGPRNPGLSLADAQQLIQELESPEFQMAAAKVYEWNEGVLNYAASASPTFKRVVQKIRGRDPGDYIPLIREFEELDEMWARSKPGPNVRTGSISKKLKGSGRRIKDPFPTMIAKAEATLRSAHERLVLEQLIKIARTVEGMGHLIEEIAVNKVPVASRSLIDLIEQIERRLQEGGGTLGEDVDPGVVDLEAEVLTFFAPAQQPDGKAPIIPIWEQGRLRWFEVDGQLYRALGALDVYRLPGVAELILAKPAVIARAGMTSLRASFGLIWNPLRDVQTMYVNTRSHKNIGRLLQAWIGGLADAAVFRVAGQRTEWMDAFVRLGGEMAQPLGQDIPHTRRAAHKLFQGKKVRIVDPRNWFDFYRDLVQFPESAPRVAELKLLAGEIGWRPGEMMSLAQSLQLLLAAKQVTTDFTAAGEFARAMNRAVPFFNSAIQGPRAHVRAAKRDPTKFATRALQFTLVSLLLWWNNKDEEWWREMLYRDRYMHHHFPFTNPFNGREELMRIPIAFEVGGIFSSFPVMMADAWYSADPDEARAWFTTFFEATTPDFEPVLLSAMLNQAANEDRFWNTPIVPQGELRRPAEEQFNEYTSRAAIAMGRIFKRSPRRIDQAIDDVFGPVGGDLLGVLGFGEQGVEREKELADMPIIGRLFQRGGRTGTRSLSVEKLYAALEEAQLRQASVRHEETAAERQQRLQLEDAVKAIQALSYVRSQTASMGQRSQLTHEIAALSADVLRFHGAGQLARERFAGRRRLAETVEKNVRRQPASATVRK
jgi:GGDEF domain-containing protein